MEKRKNNKELLKNSTKSLPFIGRKNELRQLNSLLKLDIANLVVITGRRRIGKSRLIEEFAKDMRYYKFSGLPPQEGTTADDERQEFMRQFSEQFQFPTVQASDWGDCFQWLAKQVMKGRVVVLLDEISWMATGDHNFLGKLKIAWDLYFKQNSQLILFLCGSVSAWIEHHILGGTGFLGRPTQHIRLEELPLSDCQQFWGNYSSQLSGYEKLKLLSVTGGVPRYLELINPALTPEQNIQSLCFSQSSPLLNEFKYIFNDIYGKRSSIYQSIIESLALQKMDRNDLAEKLGLQLSGDISEYSEDLVLGGFVSRDYIWDFKTHKRSNLSRLRLKDNYTRFYFRCIIPNKQRIEKGYFENSSFSQLPNWKSILALQFENLVLNNYKAIIKRLGLKIEDVLFENPYYQRATIRRPGCQIDYLIQTQHDTVYICEIKFNRQEIKTDIIDEVKLKLKNLSTPKYLSKRAVLIHVNGVHEQVLEQRFFSHIIDFNDLF